jgi:Cu-Zn family superoxide dismutase
MVKFSTDLWCLGCEKENDLLDKAVIIHNGTDDYVSQPSGASGMRIGCMEINTPPTPPTPPLTPNSSVN